MLPFGWWWRSTLYVKALSKIQGLKRYFLDKRPRWTHQTKHDFFGDFLEILWSVNFCHRKKTIQKRFAPHWNPTWQWKINGFSSRYIFKYLVFSCHFSFSGVYFFQVCLLYKWFVPIGRRKCWENGKGSFPSSFQCIVNLRDSPYKGPGWCHISWPLKQPSSARKNCQGQVFPRNAEKWCNVQRCLYSEWQGWTIKTWPIQTVWKEVGA